MLNIDKKQFMELIKLLRANHQRVDKGLAINLGYEFFEPEIDLENFFLDIIFGDVMADCIIDYLSDEYISVSFEYDEVGERCVYNNLDKIDTDEKLWAFYNWYIDNNK